MTEGFCGFADLCPLVLEPDLNNSNAQPRLGGQGVSHLQATAHPHSLAAGPHSKQSGPLPRVCAHLPAGFGGDVEGGLEGPPLLGGEDGARPLQSAGTLGAAIVVLVAARSIRGFLILCVILTCRHIHLLGTGTTLSVCSLCDSLPLPVKGPATTSHFTLLFRFSMKASTRTGVCRKPISIVETKKKNRLPELELLRPMSAALS